MIDEMIYGDDFAYENHMNMFPASMRYDVPEFLM